MSLWRREQRKKDEIVQKLTRQRLLYGSIFLLLLGIEVLIALFAHNTFMRSYFGDALVSPAMYTFLRMLFPNKCRLLPLYLFFFAVLVEIGQYFDYVTLLGLGNIRFFRILLGTSFSWWDIVSYAAGSVVCGLFEGCKPKIEKRLFHE